MARKGSIEVHCLHATVCYCMRDSVTRGFDVVASPTLEVAKLTKKRKHGGTEAMINQFG